jgi:hypothetical protein
METNFFLRKKKKHGFLGEKKLGQFYSPSNSYVSPFWEEWLFLKMKNSHSCRMVIPKNNRQTKRPEWLFPEMVILFMDLLLSTKRELNL